MIKKKYFTIATFSKSRENDNDFKLVASIQYRKTKFFENVN